MKIKIVHIGENCKGGACPTIYETDNNTFIVQGYVIDNKTKKELKLPTNEDAIEVPLEFLESFIKKSSK
jgi:hypothetical protein